jgi:hypothetical protein
VRNKFRLIVSITLGLFLVGCATAQYRIAERECGNDAFRQYPVNNQTEVRTYYKTVQVPTGQVNCTSRNAGYFTNTTCTAITVSQSVPYQQMVTVDTNENIRSQVIKSCAQSLCYTRYGNVRCKPKEAPSGNHSIERPQYNRTNAPTAGQYHELPTTHQDQGSCAAHNNPPSCSDQTDKQILDQGYR